MARKVVVDGIVYEEADTRKVVVDGLVYEATVVAVVVGSPTIEVPVTHLHVDGYQVEVDS